MDKGLSFVFGGYKANLEKGEVLFHFGFRSGKNIDFTEKISFPPVTQEIPEALLKSLLDNLMLILGISYWKLYAPSEIIIESNFLTKEQAEFWNIVYTKGLGEFFYKNKIDFRRLINLPYVETLEAKPTDFPRSNRALLGIGGGKDSIVAAEMLKDENKDFDLFTLNFPLQIEVAKAVGGKVINIRREMDSKLFTLNKQEDPSASSGQAAYNGHIPVSVIYAFLGLMAAIFYDYDNVVVGNEKSANYGNVEYLGEMINHQWSKSEEFEKLFNDYVRKFITPDITYSSPLRQMSELEVVREFVKYPKYFPVFSSCNNNFKILNSSKRTFLRGGGAVQNDNGGRWCGRCAKCLFVFICLSAFLPKKEALNIFGKNLLEDQNLIPLFEELIGVKNFKPFECVGTPEEVREALGKIVAKREFNKTALMKFYISSRFNDLNH